MAGGAQGAGAPQGGQNPLAGLNQGNFNPQALQGLVQGAGAPQGMAKPLPYGGAGAPGQQMQMPPSQGPMQGFYGGPPQGTPYGGSQMSLGIQVPPSVPMPQTPPTQMPAAPQGGPDLNQVAQDYMQRVPMQNMQPSLNQGTVFNPSMGGVSAPFPAGPQSMAQRSPVFMPNQMQRPQIQGNPNAQQLPSRDRMMQRANPMFNRMRPQ